MKVYVVLERNYEYNDETYEAFEGGNAVLAFHSRENAIDKAISLTANWLKVAGGDILYNYEDSYFIANDKLDEVLRKYGFDPETGFDWNGWNDICSKFVNDFSVEDLKIVAKNLINPMFFVEEIELES